jgi:hypothetical protein
MVVWKLKLRLEKSGNSRPVESFLVEDISGKGHKTKNLETKERT